MQLFTKEKPSNHENTPNFSTNVPVNAPKVPEEASEASEVLEALPQAQAREFSMGFLLLIVGIQMVVQATALCYWIFVSLVGDLFPNPGLNVYIYLSFTFCSLFPIMAVERSYRSWGSGYLSPALWILGLVYLFIYHVTSLNNAMLVIFEMAFVDLVSCILGMLIAALIYNSPPRPQETEEGPSAQPSPHPDILLFGMVIALLLSLLASVVYAMQKIWFFYNDWDWGFGLLLLLAIVQLTYARTKESAILDFKVQGDGPKIDYDPSDQLSERIRYATAILIVFFPIIFLIVAGSIYYK